MSFITQSERMSLKLNDILSGKSKKGIPELPTRNMNKFDIASAEGTVIAETDELSKSNSVYYANRRKCFGNQCNWIVITISEGMSVSDQEDLNFLLGVIESGKEYNFGTTLNDEVCGQFEYKDTGHDSSHSSSYASQDYMLNLTALSLKQAILDVFAITEKNIVICVNNKLYLKKSYFDENVHYTIHSDSYDSNHYKGV